MYARVVWEGPPPKKYSVLPSDRSGGRLFDISPEERQRRDAADAAFIADMEADAIVLEAVHWREGSKRHGSGLVWWTKLQRYESYLYCDCGSF
jgi:hypothetical protein